MAGKSSIIKVTVLGDADDFKKAMNETANAAEDTGDSVRRDLGESMDSFGEKAGGAEQKFIGFNDTLTGTSDLMAGISSGNFLQMGQGLADLAGAAESLWASFGKVVIQLGKKIAATAADTASTIANTAANVAHAVATGVASAATTVWTGAQWLLNAALAANPIGLVVIAIVALVAIFVVAWKHSETFRNIVTGAFDAVLGVVQGVWNWISDNWPLLLAIITGPIGTAVYLITQHWDTIKNGFTAVKDWIGEKITDIVGSITGMPGRIKNAAVGMFDGLKEAFRSALNWIIGRWNGLEFKLPGGIAGAALFGPMAGRSVGTPNIPMLADGAFIRGGRGGTLAMIGEGAKDEIVMPLDRGARNGGFGTTINVTVNVPPTANLVDAGREMTRALNRYQRTLATR